MSAGKRSHSHPYNDDLKYFQVKRFFELVINLTFILRLNTDQRILNGMPKSHDQQIFKP